MKDDSLNRKPPGGCPGGEPPAPPQPDTAIFVSPEEPRPAAWRDVQQRKKSKKQRQREAAAAEAAALAAAPPSQDPHASWMSWKRE